MAKQQPQPNEGWRSSPDWAEELKARLEGLIARPLPEGIEVELPGLLTDSVRADGGPRPGSGSRIRLFAREARSVADPDKPAQQQAHFQKAYGWTVALQRAGEELTRQTTAFHERCLAAAEGGLRRELLRTRAEDAERGLVRTAHALEGRLPTPLRRAGAAILRILWSEGSRATWEEMGNKSRPEPKGEQIPSFSFEDVARACLQSVGTFTSELVELLLRQLRADLRAKRQVLPGLETGGSAKATSLLWQRPELKINSDEPAPSLEEVAGEPDTAESGWPGGDAELSLLIDLALLDAAYRDSAPGTKPTEVSSLAQLLQEFTGEPEEQLHLRLAERLQQFERDATSVAGRLSFAQARRQLRRGTDAG